MPARYLLTAAIVAILLLGGLAAADAGLASSGGEVDVLNETFTPPGSQAVVTLNQSDLAGVRYDAATEIVVEDENGTQMVAGNDYAWNQTNGSLTALSGGRLVGDSTATIDYGFRVIDDDQNNISTAIGNTGNVARLLPLILVVGFIVAGMRAFAGVT